MFSRSIQKFIACACLMMAGIASIGIFCKKCSWIMRKHPDTPVFSSKEIPKIESGRIYGASSRSAVANMNTAGTMYFCDL